MSGFLASQVLKENKYRYRYCASDSMANKSFYYRKTVKRSVDKLINKQYPEDEFVLDDDIIVLTKVDIRRNNPEGETDDSEGSDDELAKFYEQDNEDDVDDDFLDSDPDDFIDDTSENELSEESDENPQNDSPIEEVEDREYDSTIETEDENENEDGNQSETDSDSDNEVSKSENKENEVNNGNGNERNASDSDDDDDIIVSPRKKAKFNVISDSDGSQSESENNEEHEIKNTSASKRNFNDDDDDEDDDDNDDSIVSPSKKAKINVINDDDGSQSENENNEEDGESVICISDDDERKVAVTPSNNAKSSIKNDVDTSGSSGNELEGGSSNSNSQNTNSQGESSQGTSQSESSQSESSEASTQFPAGGASTRVEKDENKFGVYLLPRIENKSTCLRYHGRIGMGGIKGHCKPMIKSKFCKLVSRKRVLDGFTRLNLMFVNARHLENRYRIANRHQDEEIPHAVRKLLIHIVDQWFPIGIPKELHLNRAIDLLECLKRKISAGKIPSLRHSNKFYELIPHTGDPRRRPRFRDVEQCDNKIKYVEIMKLAVNDCFSKFDPNFVTKYENPWNDFLNNWLRIELQDLEPTDQAYKILNEVAVNTQHPNAARRFGVANIFKVDNMNPETNGDFSTNIYMNHRYLFHYTFASNLPCILREGLTVALKHIHSINRFLGEGIYFWDAIANAGLNYNSINTVYVLVCRVALGKEQQVEQPYLKHGETLDWNEDSDSIYCLGKEFSSSRDDEMDFNGAKIYSGKLAEKTDNLVDRYSLYNEYVVRNKNQVIIEYIIKLEKEEEQHNQNEDLNIN